MRKGFSLLLILTLVLSFAGISAFADGGIEKITFKDGSMFTVSLEEGDSFKYDIKGLAKNPDGSYRKVDISDPQNITWATSNPSVVDFDGSASGKIVSVEAGAEGKAKITATYNGMSVVSNVTVTPKSIKATVKNISVTVKGEKTSTFTVDIASLDNFSLKKVYGNSYNDSGVMQDKVTALHAFLYALEEHYDAGGVADGWQWVPNNVVVGYNGAFVSKVGTDVNYGMTGWMYKVNGELPMHAASQHVMNKGDQERWGFATWGEEW
ncbi:DUF4430 domain-containing protein [Lutibacter sp. B2]|nr:DUF4430 domain-containing protein [Lutibacter sp. B2]